MKGMLRLTILEAAIAIALLRLICEPLQAIAQGTPDQPPSVLLAYDSSPATGSPSTGIGSGAIRYIPPAGDPPRSGGVGTIRGLCGSQGTKPGLRALVPASDVKDASNTLIKVIWGQTVSDHPTLWFDVPYTSKGTLKMEFALQDSKGAEVYRDNIPLPTIPGIVSIQVPATIPPLQPDQQYFWTLQVECPGADTNDKNDVVQGWIRRVRLEQVLMAKLKEAKGRNDIHQQAALYAQNSLWFEALTTLGNALKANPDNAKLVSAWKALLESAELQGTASQPMAKP